MKNEENIRLRLYTFFRDMKKWQTDNESAGKLLDKDPSQLQTIYPLRRQELIKIFDRNCVYKNAPERLDIGYGNGYDPDLEEVIDVKFTTNKNVVVTTLDMTQEFEMYSRYFLVYNGTDWRLEDKKKQSYMADSDYFKCIL
jgi:hypothetical protein